MDTGVGTDLSRVTVIAPEARIDVALPVDVPLGDLLPTLLRHTGGRLADRGGWTLQRLGESPLDDSATVTDCGIRDGDLLYLRPHQAQLPELAFDDVADAIATAQAEESRRWSDRHTRTTALGAALVSLGLMGALLLRSGPVWWIPAVVAGVVALALLATGTALSRAVGDGPAGTVTGSAGIAFAALSGAMALGGGQGPGGWGPLSLVGASAGLTVMSVVTALAVADAVPALVGTAVAGGLILLAAATELATDLDAASVAALTVSVVLALTQAVPTLSIRLAELPLPVIPLSADDVRSDTSTVAGHLILQRTLVAHRYLTALTAAVAVVVIGCEIVLARYAGGAALWLLAVVALVVALRARVVPGRAQRLWLILAAVVGGGLLGVAASNSSGAGFAVATAVTLTFLAVATGLLLTAALRIPGRRLSPVWGRLTDILDGMLVASVLPLALAVLGVYGYVRGING